jgi:predicted phage terminase large subunit-like protein
VTIDALDDRQKLILELQGSYLFFCQFFFPFVTGREFHISQPVGRESHFVTISRELTKVARLETLSLLINVPPGHGKSVMMCMWMAWTMSQFQNSQYLYISYGHELAAKHTAFVKRIIECSQYRSLFGINVRQDSRAKDFFQTETGATVKAFGSSGAIVGQDAGLPNCEHFTGAIILDDMIKVDEAHSDTIRERVIQNYRETILQRPRGPNVPIISIGQRVHEQDISAYMLSGQDERKYRAVVLKAIDDAGNALYPELNPLDQLLEKKDKNPYVFASQYQQNPIPSGGALFKPQDFVELDEEPEILMTFITADTAETSKSYNDASAFSFWGMYKLPAGQLALHWLDCLELRIEPKDLESEFMSFYGDCMLHACKPLVAAIEQKSTGVTLCSILKNMRGLRIIEVKRTKTSGSKANRYLEMQPIIASKLISFTRGAKHKDVVVSHMMKITANDSHRWDDICDTAYDAIKLALIDKTLLPEQDVNKGDIVKSLAQDFQQKLTARTRSYGYADAMGKRSY